MDNSCVPLNEIRIDPTFSNLFPRRQHVLDGLKEHIKTNGFDEAFPLIIGDGPWAYHDVLIDGHSWLQVCQELGVNTVPVVRRLFETEKEALEYVIHVQKDRRNLTDAEIINCVGTLDQTRLAGRRKKLASCEANSEPGKSAKRTAGILGVSRTKIEKVRSILKHGDDEMKQSIQSGKSINQAYKEIQVKRKEDKDNNVSGAEASTLLSEHVLSEKEAAGSNEAPPESVQEDQSDHEIDEPEPDTAVDDLAVSTSTATSDARGWGLEVINGFDCDSVDYIIVGQGTPPATMSEDQQLFVEPRLEAAESEDPDTEDEDDDEAYPYAPPPWSGIVDLRNYDAEGWAELEKHWPKDNPHFRPEPAQESEVPREIEEKIVGVEAASGDEPQPWLESEAPSVDPALEKIAVALESGQGEWTRLERWAKRSGVIVHTLPDNTRKIDRRKFFILAPSMGELNNILKGPVKPEYAWFPEAFHRICRKNGSDVPMPDCTDGFEVNLLLDHLSFKGVYSGGKHHLQNEESVTKKLEFLMENWAEVCATVKKNGFAQDRPDSPSFDWVILHGENVFDCIHQKMAAIAEFQLNKLLEDHGIAWN